MNIVSVRPIPAELLTDSVTLRTPTAAGYSEKQLSDVRVVRTSEVTDHLSGKARDITGIVMYFDCVNSLPEGTEFTAGQSLRYCGEVYEIVEAVLFAGEQPHHYRVRARKTGGEFSPI